MELLHRPLAPPPAERRGYFLLGELLVEAVLVDKALVSTNLAASCQTRPN